MITEGAGCWVLGARIPTTVYRNAVADLGDQAHAFALRHLEKVLGVKVAA